ncbi:unnamed protein product [Closterium sp. Yama58-4]|nr:unnamed protein product [Closterium sp. Yama58-4]
MRAEMCDHRDGTLATKLQAEGIVMPTPPHTARALDSAMMVQDDDDIVELKSEKEMQSTDTQLVVLAAKIGAVSLALRYDEDQLLAGAAHFLTTHTPIVDPIVKGMGAGKDTEAVANSIAAALHTTPRPLPRHPAGQVGVRLSKLASTTTSPVPTSKPQSPRTPHLVGSIPTSGAGISGCREKASGATVGKPPRARERTREGRTGHTGVRYDPETGKYYAKLVWGRGSRQQIRLGSYTDEIDAAYAYAAAAHVLRPKVISKGAVRLSDSDIAALSGCTGEHIRALVRKRKWWRWREWMVALSERGHVFHGQGEGHDAAERSVPSSASEDSDAQDDEYPLTQKGEGDVHMKAEGEANGGWPYDGGLFTSFVDMPMGGAVRPRDTHEDTLRNVIVLDQDEPCRKETGEDTGYLSHLHTCGRPKRRGPSKSSKTAPTIVRAGDDGASAHSPRASSGRRVAGETAPSASGSGDAAAESQSSQQPSQPAEASRSRRVEDVVNDTQAPTGGANAGSSRPVVLIDDPADLLPEMPRNYDGDVGTRIYRDYDNTPVSREEFNRIVRAHEETLAALAQLETVLLAKIEHEKSQEKARKRKRGRGNETRSAHEAELSDIALSDDEVRDRAPNARHKKTAKSAILQRALEVLPADKPWKNICEQVRVHMFLERRNEKMTFYPSSEEKTAGVCAVVDNLPQSYASLALAACKARRADLNRSLSDWKTAAAGRVRDIALPRIGLFRDERDALSPWATPKARSIAKVRTRTGLDASIGDKVVLSRWSHDRRGMPFASGAFTACARTVFKPKMLNGTITLKLYHLAWIEHLVTDAILNWEQRKGCLSNSASVNAHMVKGLQTLVFDAIVGAIDKYNPPYDPDTKTFEWGRHGLRLSTCGLEETLPDATGDEESERSLDEVSVSHGNSRMDE